MSRWGRLVCNQPGADSGEDVSVFLTRESDEELVRGVINSCRVWQLVADEAVDTLEIETTIDPGTLGLEIEPYSDGSDHEEAGRLTVWVNRDRWRWSSRGGSDATSRHQNGADE